MTLILTNDDVAKLVTMRECIDIIEEGFRALGRGEASGRPRSLNYSPLKPGEPDDYYAFTTCDAALPSRQTHILRITSDRMAIRRDGGDFDQLTGASITPRAVVKAIKETLLYFEAHRDDVFARIGVPAEAEQE